MAARLRRLFDLVTERAEPYSAMFEVHDEIHPRQMVEIYAAPLAVPETSEATIMAVINTRREAMP